ncbi:MAG TPA: hypothetical protein VNP90_02715 [Actinomycetota bacterium]|nr:hypothetical protein [Actinomycetota bacterium]
MMRDLVVVVLAGVLAAGVACSGSDGDADGSACPDGLTRTESSSDAAGPGTSTREEAVRAELERLEMAASDEAIAAGVVASAPGESAGTEELVVENDQGVEVTMLLAPLDPGWAVERSTWCEPV